MEQRKELILNIIIKEHIKTGLPVGSNVLVKKYKLDISPATARNEMANLEEEGFIKQPHTSAGRVPTEKAYKFFLDKILKKDYNKNKLKININKFKANNSGSCKKAAKEMAKISNCAAFWACSAGEIYYTGLSNLFQQLNFVDFEQIYELSGVMDRIDEIVDEIFKETPQGIKILIGSENPFSNSCSVIVSKYNIDDESGMFGVLSAMRMDYERNLAIINEINNLINKS